MIAWNNRYYISASFQLYFMMCEPLYAQIKSLYDFLLGTNYDLGAISHRFRHTPPQSSKPPHTSLNPPPDQGDPSNFAVKLTMRTAGGTALVCSDPCDPSFSRFVTIHTRHKRRQTDNIHTLWQTAERCIATVGRKAYVVLQCVFFSEIAERSRCTVGWLVGWKFNVPRNTL